ncbi:MAG: type I-U CRISPR-associated protein Csx17, partial [Lentisphaerae bacterium]|nr:type I-U CRISPR-associated protein Csx17 [Lentisphaerota bacterium]
MSLHIHHLTGCAPAPLAHYLKALGILRLVAEQKDPSARLWWQDEHAVLATTLDKENLQRFFLKEYAPSPVLGPWAARSGFFSGSSERSAREALLSLEQCSDSRFSVIVNCIDACRKVLNRHGISEKAADETKTDLLFWCRNELPRDMTPWFDACFVLESYLEKTEKRRSFPAIFGSGGNEGSGSYVSNFAQAIDRALVKHSCV